MLVQFFTESSSSWKKYQVSVAGNLGTSQETGRGFQLSGGCMLTLTEMFV